MIKRDEAYKSVVKLIFNLNNDIVFAFFIAFAMPTAGLSTTFADQFGGDTKHSVIYLTRKISV